VLANGWVIGKDFAKSVEFFDVDRVEILRGPQGTTFGRNASAGLVHIFNKRPSRDFSAYVEGTVGDYNLYEINGIVNGAISDTVRGRLGVHYDDRDGYTTDVSDGRHLDGVQNTSVRGQLLVEPSDSVSVWLKAEWSKDDDRAPVRKPVESALAATRVSTVRISWRRGRWKTNVWHRDRTVGSTFERSVVQKTKTRCGGGSSISFRSAFHAASVS